MLLGNDRALQQGGRHVRRRLACDGGRYRRVHYLKRSGQRCDVLVADEREIADACPRLDSLLLTGRKPRGEALWNLDSDVGSGFIEHAGGSVIVDHRVNNRRLQPGLLECCDHCAAERPAVVIGDRDHERGLRIRAHG